MMESQTTEPTKAKRSLANGVRLRGAGVALGLLASAGLVWQSSQAAFEATTSNPGNTWTVGSVVLTDSVPGAAWFSVTSAKPLDTQTKCVDVTYSGSLAADVRFYGAGHTNVDTLGGAGQLGNRLNLTITRGAVGTTCAGLGAQTDIFATASIETFRAAHTVYADGIGTSTHQWAPPGGVAVARPYVFTWILTDGSSDSMGDSYTIDFTWEARNT